MSTSTEIPEISECNICPNVNVKNTTSACSCGPNKWWSGEECVLSPQCPCVYNHVKYNIGTLYETEDCMECVCRLNGLSDCSIKKCPKCESVRIIHSYR